MLIVVSSAHSYNQWQLLFLLTSCYVSRCQISLIKLMFLNII